MLLCKLCGVSNAADVSVDISWFLLIACVNRFSILFCSDLTGQEGVANVCYCLTHRNDSHTNLFMQQPAVTCF